MTQPKQLQFPTAPIRAQTMRRPKPPRSSDVSAVVAYLRALEKYCDYLEGKR